MRETESERGTGIGRESTIGRDGIARGPHKTPDIPLAPAVSTEADPTQTGPERKRDTDTDQLFYTLDLLYDYVDIDIINYSYYCMVAIDGMLVRLALAIARVSGHFVYRSSLWTIAATYC